ncbi:hypothetical protein GCM10007049_07990 [Echinicola pacifica]|uniref:Uncharacterized protein n=1 Tax=Echinicola pacifica TaxID=346377 RepID=A0A918PRU0_9BACT|nr:DUF6702 family protein [Echinicola pacifica]GGZ18257.1 hypothetical protein GCM10007049_07990 [Echinicola pacifica]
MFYNYIAYICLGWAVWFHPFYISVTDFRYNEEHKTLEMSQKIFWDDLELALTNMAGAKVDFLNPANPPRLDSLVKHYLISNNQITINGKEASLSYLGFEVEEDAAWFYLEAEQVDRPIKVEVKTTILTSDFPDQRNMINFYLNKRPKSLILNLDKDTGVLNFE